MGFQGWPKLTESDHVPEGINHQPNATRPPIQSRVDSPRLGERTSQDSGSDLSLRLPNPFFVSPCHVVFLVILFFRPSLDFSFPKMNTA